MPQTIEQAPPTVISATWLPSPISGNSTSDMSTWVPGQGDAQPYFASQDHEAAINCAAGNGSASQMLGVGEDIEVNDVHPHAGEQSMPFGELSTPPRPSPDEASQVDSTPANNSIDFGAAQEVSEDIVEQERTNDTGEGDLDFSWTLLARYHRVLELETSYFAGHSQLGETPRATDAQQTSQVDTARSIIKHHKRIEDMVRNNDENAQAYSDWLNEKTYRDVTHANLLKLWRDNERNLEDLLAEDEDEQESQAIKHWINHLKKQAAMGIEIKARHIRFEQLENNYIENMPSQEDDRETLDSKRGERATLIQKLVKHHTRAQGLANALVDDQWNREHQDWLAENILSEISRDQALVAWRLEHADLLSMMDQAEDEEEVKNIRELVEAIENEDENADEAEEEGDGETGGDDEDGNDEEEGNDEEKEGDDEVEEGGDEEEGDDEE